MTVYGTEVLRALLGKIQEGQIDVSGDEVGVFERLLQLGLVFHNGDGGPEGYKGVCTTREGDIYMLDVTPYPPLS